VELSWTLLALLAAMLAAAWFWHDSLGARENANAAALDTCQSTGATLLDGTVAFRKLETVRVAGGSLGSGAPMSSTTPDGATRQQGFVVLTGHSVDSVGCERAYPFLRPRAKLPVLHPRIPAGPPWLK